MRKRVNVAAVAVTTVTGLALVSGLSCSVSSAPDIGNASRDTNPASTQLGVTDAGNKEAAVDKQSPGASVVVTENVAASAAPRPSAVAPTASQSDAASGSGCGPKFRELPFEPIPNPAPQKPAQTCGDLLVQIGACESCDDGNRESGDGCASDCSAIEPGYQCPADGGRCARIAVCGDGARDGFSEICDDGNSTSGDGCAADCSRVEPGFTCDEPGAPCRAHRCGDGMWEGTESCDDGNLEAMDGCSETCHVEPGIGGDGGVASCGDGILTGEDCDDGNRLSQDGCDSNCQTEPAFQCSEVTTTSCVNDGTACRAWLALAPKEGWQESLCTPICGDGVIAGGEACDDGVNLGGYGKCQPGCVLGERCGDGIKNGPEQCDTGGVQTATCVACRIRIIPG